MSARSGASSAGKLIRNLGSSLLLYCSFTGFPRGFAAPGTCGSRPSGWSLRLGTRCCRRCALDSRPHPRPRAPCGLAPPSRAAIHAAVLCVGRANHRILPILFSACPVFPCPSLSVLATPSLPSPLPRLRSPQRAGTVAVVGETTAVVEWAVLCAQPDADAADPTRPLLIDPPPEQ